MPKWIREYDMNERCTAYIVSDIMCVSWHTGRRRMTELRKAKGLPPKSFVSVGEFMRFFRLI